MLSGGLKTSFLECSCCAQRELAKCIAVLSKRLASILGTSSAKRSKSVLSTGAAAAGTASFMSSGPSSKGSTQSLDIFR